MFFSTNDLTLGGILVLFFILTILQISFGAARKRNNSQPNQRRYRNNSGYRRNKPANFNRHKNTPQPPQYDEEDYPYTLQPLFSPAEMDFFKALYVAIDRRAILLSKVRLGDLFSVPRDNESYFWSHINRINKKHVDYVLCDRKTFQPILAIELDDYSSHSRPDRQKRDALVDNIFASTTLPLLHVPVRREFSVAEIAQIIAPYLPAKAPVHAPPQRTQAAISAKPQTKVAQRSQNPAPKPKIQA